MFWIVFLVFLAETHQYRHIDNEMIAQLTSIDEENEQSNNTFCVCVPYWQCKDDYSGLLDEISDILDLRNSRQATSSSSKRCTGDFDVCCRLQCGRRNAETESPPEGDLAQRSRMAYRILGENPNAQFAEFPWMLGILEKDVYRCGASLVHPEVAMTAAHCVEKNGNYIIRAGEWNWEEETEAVPHQNRNSKKIIIHPNYHGPSLTNDIALITLDAPFDLGETVNIVCIPPHESAFDFKRCITSGWGKNSQKRGSFQSTLKKLELPIVPRQKCLNMLQNAKLGPYFNLHSSFICAGGEHKDTCKGDGGSPLMCPVLGHDNRYEQVGIVSWGLTCGMKNTPGVYVNVPKFSKWIDKQLNKLNLDTHVYKIQQTQH